jgi:GNAT superfamily N-acetyltransferase
MDASKSPQINFRLAERTPNDAEQFCALSNSLYARPVNKAYYDWQFFQCPFTSLLNAAVDEQDKIVGTYALHVQDAQPLATKIAWVLDIMVSPQIQRQGIFRKLVDYGFENLKTHDAAAIVVMANEKADRACVEGLGWKRINTFLTYFAKPDKSHGENEFVLEYEKINDFSSCRDIFKANNISLFANARTVDYQNWRFIKNARYGYDIFAAHKNGEPFGYLVLKIFRDPVSGQAFGDIVDIFWIEPDAQALSDMLRFSLAHFYEQNVGSSAMWLQTNTLLDKIGTEIGFVRSEQKRFFCGKALKEDFKHLEDASSWFINMSDSEVY